MSKYVTGKKRMNLIIVNVGMLVTTRRNAEMQDQDRNKCQHLV
jgi:hypothetical protein